MEKIYLLGHPVAHSKSPVMHNALYQELGLDWHYDLMDCATPEEAKAFMDKGEFLALNVTMPYKPLAFQNAKLQAPSSLLAQGANVYTWSGDDSVCYNVDGEGAVHNLVLKGFDFNGKKAVICGTGPTSMAILHATAMAGVSEITLLSRNTARSQEIMDGYLATLGSFAQSAEGLVEDAFISDYKTAFENVTFSASQYDAANEIISAADLIVDATPLGMNPGDPAVIDCGLLNPGQVVFDTVYNHGVTALMADCEKAGVTYYDGSGMLIAQAITGVNAWAKAAGVELKATFGEMFDIMKAAFDESNK